MITITSAVINGIEAHPIAVEVDIRHGLPGFEIVGLAGVAVKESRERIRSALKNSEFNFPTQKVVVNLAPADVKKNGTLYDLPIAIGILAAMKHIPSTQLEHFIIAGELSLNGELRPIPGVISIAELAAKLGRKLLIPSGNSTEAAAVCQNVYPVDNLLQVQAFFNNYINIHTVKQPQFTPQQLKPCTSLVKGQAIAKRVIDIAVTGHHHTLLVGPPGTGKTLLAQSAQYLLPPITHQEAVQNTKIYSNFQSNNPHNGLMNIRPVRMPHHSISKVGLLGGGNPVQPGEITLANNGLLILDELLEFSNDALQGLREPLETHQITIIRANERIIYPAKFLMIATANACPCGYLGDPYHECHCSQQQIQRYHRKLTGPLVDRIDLFLFLEPVKVEEYQQDNSILKPIDHWNQPNGLLTDQQVQSIPLTPPVRSILSKAAQTLRLSTRGYYKTIKVAKTIADMEGCHQIEEQHVMEALRYRWEALSVFR